MKQVIRGAIIGGIIGVTLPICLAVGNEFFWSRSSGGTVEPRICFAERLWNLQRIQIKHAPGCKNKILDTIPIVVIFSILSGSSVGALKMAKAKQKAHGLNTKPLASMDSGTKTINVHRSVDNAINVAKNLEGRTISDTKKIDPLQLLKHVELIGFYGGIAGALLVVGMGAIKILEAQSTGGANQIQIWNPLRQKTQHQYFVYIGYKAYPRNDFVSGREAREQCLKAKDSAIDQDSLTQLLSDGGEVVTQGEETWFGTDYYYDLSCSYIPYIVKH